MKICNLRADINTNVHNIYFLEIINDKIIINNDCKGLLIYNKKFALIKKLDIFKGIMYRFLY